MAKFYGAVGYTITKDSENGVWINDVTERMYYGDVQKLFRRWDSADQVNENMNLNNQISIIADAYAYENFSAIRYVKWMGATWKVSSIEVERPRLILSVGGLWNGETS